MVNLFFLSYRPNAVSGAYLVIRSSVLYITGFLDFARNDIVLNTLLNFTKRFCLAKIFGNKEQSHLRLTLYVSNRVDFYAYCDALAKAKR